MYVEPDRVLFLGDCLCDSSAGALTSELAFPLFDTILGFDAAIYVEGHHSLISSRADIECLNQKMRFAESVVREGSGIGVTDDEDTQSFLGAFRAGHVTDS